MRRILILLGLLVPCTLAFATGTRYYVIPTGNDASAGTSWAAAFQTFRHADSVATTGDTIWVAAGTYTPAVSDPNAYFKLKSGVAIYGGFTGTETALDQRNWSNNVTTLSGGGTSHDVVYSLFSDATAVLDGFVVSGGSSTSDGAGINLLVASPTLSNLTITGNHTTANGGGLCNNSGNPTITNCSFIQNTAAYGGGMYNYSGGVPVISRCIFRNDTATTFGGGFYNSGNVLNVQDVLFDGNHTSTGGGGFYEDAGSTYVNITLYGNTSKYGGGIFVTGSGAAIISNSIAWNDSATTNGAEIYSTSSASTGISYTLVRGGVSGPGIAGSGSFTDGGHNLDLDPLFTDSSSHDFTLTSSSPAVDSGNNAVVVGSIDLAGNTRISHGLVDIGAYEYQDAPLAVQLIDFTATSTATGAELDWQTATEIDNFGFDVERRVESNPQWSNVAFIKGVGTSTSPHRYTFIDGSLSTGRYSYRLKQIDQSGLSKYSKEVEIDAGLAPQKFTLEQNYPNPFNPTTTIGFTLANDGRVSLKVYDMMGREVATLLDENRKAGEYQQVVFDASRYASGVYFAVLQSGEKQLIKKMLMVK